MATHRRSAAARAGSLAIRLGATVAMLLPVPAEAQLDWHGSSPAELEAARRTLDRWTSPTTRTGRTFARGLRLEQRGPAAVSSA